MVDVDDTEPPEFASVPEALPVKFTVPEDAPAVYDQLKSCEPPPAILAEAGEGPDT